MINVNAIAVETSARRVAKKHLEANFDRKSIDAKLKVTFDNGKTNQKFSVTLKIDKDKVIWIKGTKLITVFKAKITPTSVSYYSPLAKNYFEGNFSLIENLLGVAINFEQLQNLFLGQALLNLKKEKQQLTIVGNKYVLHPINQSDLFDIFFTINPSHFKLDNQYLINDEKKMRLDIRYNGYQLLQNTVFPATIQVLTKFEKSTTKIDLSYKSVVFDVPIYMNFQIPKGYKKINF